MDKGADPNIAEIMRVLLAAGADPRLDQKNGNTPTTSLAWGSTSTRRTRKATFLYKKGARIDVKNKAGRTALEAVLRAGETSDDTVSLLKQLSAPTTTGARDAAATTN